MTEQEFQEAIRKGTGRAILILQENPDADFWEIIIHACKNNLAYDAQSEGSRAEYLWEIINFSKYNLELKDKILSELLKVEDDDWAVYQLFDLAKLIAKEGNALARTIMYSKFKELILTKDYLVGHYTIIELDGVEGLLCMSSDQSGQK